MQARFQQIAMPHLDAVYRVARSLVSNDNDADDLVQETFARAYRAFDRFELRQYGARPWLLRILHNTYYTLSAKRQREPTLLDDVDFGRFVEELDSPNEEPMSADAVNWDRFDEELKAAVMQLQPEYREILLLWALEGLSYREIAEVCQCPVGTVMSRLYRARQNMLHRLRDYARKRNLKSQRLE